jgi:hypothetical protein
LSAAAVPTVNAGHSSVTSWYHITLIYHYYAGRQLYMYYFTTCVASHQDPCELECAFY